MKNRRALLLIGLGCAVAFVLGTLARGRWRPPTFEELSRLPGQRLVDFYSVPRPVLERLARRADEDRRVLYGTGELFSQSGQPDTAVKAFERNLSYEPRSVRLRARLLSVSVGRGERPARPERVATWAGQGLDLDPDNALFDYVFASLELQRDNSAAAWASLKIGFEKPYVETYNADAARGGVLALKALGYSESAARIVGTLPHAGDFAVMLRTLASLALARASAPGTPTEEAIALCEGVEKMAAQIERRSFFVILDVVALDIRRDALERLRALYAETDPAQGAEIASRLQEVTEREAHLEKIQQAFGTPLQDNPFPLRTEQQWVAFFDEVLDHGEAVALQKEWKALSSPPDASPARDASPPHPIRRIRATVSAAQTERSSVSVGGWTSG